MIILNGKFKKIKSVALFVPVTIPNIPDTGIAPDWITPEGSLGTFSDSDEISFTLEVIDQNDDFDYFEISSGSLPSGLSFNQFSGLIEGIANTVESDTTFDFTITAIDTENNTNSRNFSITITHYDPSLQWITPEGTLTEISYGSDLYTIIQADIV